MNYKVVGAINLLLGVLQIAYSLYMMIFISPKLLAVVPEFGLEVPIFYFAKYEILSLILFIGIISSILSLRLFFKSWEKLQILTFVSLGLSIASLIYITYSVGSYYLK